MNKGVLAVGLLVTTPVLGLLALNIDRDPRTIASPLILRPAPDVVLQKLDGMGADRLSALRGKPAVVNFWASWCLPCVQEHGPLIEGARDNPDVAFVGIVYEDSAENARAFLAEHGAAYPSYTDEDGKAAVAFGIYGVPETFFIDASGTITDKHVGPLDALTVKNKLAAARR